MACPQSHPEVVFGAQPDTESPREKINKLRRRFGLAPFPPELFADALTDAQRLRASQKDVAELVAFTRKIRELRSMLTAAEREDAVAILEDRLAKLKAPAAPIAASRDGHNPLLADAERRAAGLPPATMALSREHVLDDIQRRLEQQNKRIFEYAVQERRKRLGIPEPVSPLVADAQRRADAAATAAR